MENQHDSFNQKLNHLSEQLKNLKINLSNQENLIQNKSFSKEMDDLSLQLNHLESSLQNIESLIKQKNIVSFNSLS